MSANRGGMSTFYAQQITTHRKGRVSFDVYAEREATLSGDLRHIESRGLRSIWLITRPGYNDEHLVKFSRDDIAALMHACERALADTENDPTDGAR